MKKTTIRHFILWTLAFGLCTGVFSCKKDKDSDTTLDSLTGVPSFTVSPYLQPGDVLELTPADVKKQDGKSAGIYWSFSYASSVRDTTRFENGTGDASITITVPDTLNALTLTCVAFAENYYNTVQSQTVAVVHGQDSFSGLGLEDAAVFEDPRDGRLYPFVVIGDREWFARNLAYDGGASYRDAVAMQDVLGQYYAWEDAMTSCPEGWRLPDAGDWAALARTAGVDDDGAGVYRGLAGQLMADAYFNDGKMWEFFSEVVISNKWLFSAIPGGYGVDADGKHTFYDLNLRALFWTAEEAEGDRAYCFHIFVSSPDVAKSALDKKSLLANVRCVRDAE